MFRKSWMVWNEIRPAMLYTRGKMSASLIPLYEVRKVRN